MRSRLVVVLACVVVAALLVALSVEARPRRTAPSRWVPVGKPARWEKHSVLVLLKQNNIEKLAELTLAVSTPSNPKYGDHLTADQVLDMIAPPATETERLIEHLQGKCLSDDLAIENMRDALRLTASVRCLERIFSVRLLRWKHEASGHSVIRVDGQQRITLPTGFDTLIEQVTLLNEFPPIPRLGKNKHATDVPAPAAAVSRSRAKAVAPATPSDLQLNFVIPTNARAVYHIPPGTKGTAKANSQAVIEFLPIGAPYISDMQLFANLTTETFTNFSKIVGPFVDNGFADESTLDIELIMGIATSVPNTYVTVADGWILEMAQLIFSIKPSPPLVNSVSYGWPESLACQSGVTHANCTGVTVQQYVERADKEMMKIGALGCSMIVCTQDEGAPSEANMQCELDSTQQPVWPIFPGTSAWGTSVSGTTLVDSVTPPSSNIPICQKQYTCANGTVEQACMTNNTYYRYTTGGGFSNYTAMPGWQKGAVAAYFASNPSLLPPSFAFNKSNRAYPDISAFGARVLIVENGAVGVEEGTSAATPIIGAVFSLLNDWRLNNGKKPLGFLNPLLYEMAAKHPAAFNLVPVGSNECTIGQCCKYGYSSGPQWDPVTGLGTPNYDEMLKYIKTLK